MRNGNEFRNNAVNRCGVVVDRDPKKMRVKVRFEDEDDTVMQWIDVVSKSSTGVSAFMMPGKDDEVWCAMDAKGEAGCIIGSRYNSKDAASGDANEKIVVTFPGGSFVLDTAAGVLELNLSAALKVKATNIILDAEIDLGGEGGKELHRKGDADSDGDVAVGSASRVRAV